MSSNVATNHGPPDVFATHGMEFVAPFATRAVSSTPNFRRTPAASDRGTPRSERLGTNEHTIPFADEGVTWEERYAVGPEIGRGGRGIVREGRDLLLDRLVALKVLHESAFPPGAEVTREARALAAVEHPNVVRVHGVYPSANPPFLVMERVRGRSLSSIASEGRLSIARLLPILRQVALGLDAIHAAGLVHGDVKPDNVVVDDDGAAKLVDAGLAPLLAQIRPGELVGTPAYMAPERAGGLVVPAALASRTDVYSFAVMCFELLTGRLPFTGASSKDVLWAHATQRAPMPSYSTRLSTEFDAPMAAAMSKSPERRTATCTALVDGLERASKGCDLYGRRLKIVVADDEESQRLLLMTVLGAYLPGASVVLCATGRGVLDAISSEPSVAVLDLTMPPPSGMELVAQVRALSPSTAIVIVTGAGSGREREIARRLGIKRFLIKPFEVDELVLAIREAVEQTSQRQPT
jgi:CheY-like chemotaxis protein